MKTLHGVFAALVGSDAHRVGHTLEEDFAVARLAGLGILDDRRHDRLRHVVGSDDLDSGTNGKRDEMLVARKKVRLFGRAAHPANVGNAEATHA